MAVHGDITEINYSHPTLGSGTFFAVANQGNTYDEGGFRNSDDENSIASNGDLIIQKNRVRGSFEVVIENDQNIRNDAAKLKELAASGISATWTFSLVNGTVYKGDGVPVGDIKPDLNTGQLSLKVAGREFSRILTP